MTQRGFPLNDEDVGVTQWRAMARNWMTTGVLPGFLLDLEVFGDSSGRQVKVRTGAAIVEGHYYDSDATETLALAANSSGNPRRDLVVVRVNTSVVPATITLVVIQGTPSGSPTTPAHSTTSTIYDLPLGYATVADGAVTIDAGDVVDLRVWARPRGMPVQAKLGGGTDVFTGIGIASSAHPATGRFTCVFLEAVDSNASIQASCEYTGNLNAVVHARTTTTCEIRVYDNANNLADPNWVTITVARADM